MVAVLHMIMVLIVITNLVSTLMLIFVMNLLLWISQSTCSPGIDFSLLACCESESLSPHRALRTVSAVVAGFDEAAQQSDLCPELQAGQWGTVGAPRQSKAVVNPSLSDLKTLRSCLLAA